MAPRFHNDDSIVIFDVKKEQYLIDDSRKNDLKDEF